MAHRFRTKRTTVAELARRKQYASREHRQQHQRDAALVATGTAICWRCHRPIPPHTKWHSGHDDHDRRIYRGPEHATCNQRAAARMGALTANRRTSRLTW